MRGPRSLEPATYSDWLDAHKRWGPDSIYTLYALEVLVREGEWTPAAPGSPQMVYVHTTQSAEPYLRTLVRSGLAEQIAEGTWMPTPAGKALDHGRSLMCAPAPVRHRDAS
jgi:hypothetical protein